MTDKHHLQGGGASSHQWDKCYWTSSFPHTAADVQGRHLMDCHCTKSQVTGSAEVGLHGGPLGQRLVCGWSQRGRCSANIRSVRIYLMNSSCQSVNRAVEGHWGSTLVQPVGGATLLPLFSLQQKHQKITCWWRHSSSLHFVKRTQNQPFPEGSKLCSQQLQDQNSRKNIFK